MYCSEFGLSRQPFQITPDTSFFFPEGERQALLEGLVYAIEQGEGIIKVVGEVGTGKTLLSRKLEQALPEQFDIVYLVNPVVACRDMILAVADELGLAGADGLGPVARLNQLYGHLLERYRQGRRVVVIIDEAQGITLQALEELRLLGNLETDTSKLLQVVLFGQPELDDHLDDRSVRQIKERITQHFRLRPLTRVEIGAYLRHRLHYAGYRGPDVFGPLALALLALASRGLLRRVNILADKALLAAFTTGVRYVGTVHVLAAMRDSNSSARRKPLRSRGLAAAMILLSGSALALLGPWPQVANLWQANPAPGSAAIAQVATTVPVAAVDKVQGHHTPVALAEAPPVEAITPPGDPLARRLAATRSRMEGLARRTFSIQIMQVAGTQGKALAQRLRQSPWRERLEDLYLYPLGQRQAPSHDAGDILVLFGTFETMREARQALAGLPVAMKRWTPYVRNFPHASAPVVASVSHDIPGITD